MSKIAILGYASSSHTIRWANAMQQKGCDITVISCCGEPIDGIETIIFGKSPGSSRDCFKYLRSVRIKLRKLKPDLIHAFQATGYGHWGASRDACPKLLTAMGSDIVITGRKSLWHKWYIGSAVKKYNFYTTPSLFLKKTMNQLFKATDGRTQVIPFGVDIPDLFKKHQTNDSIRLVYMKNLKRVYGPDLLIEAMVILKEKKISATLDIYGFGREEKRLKETVSRSGLNSLVNFMGFISHDEVMNRYLDYDIMVMPSRSESFGVAAVEASAVGLPVVAADVGGISEVVLNEKTGILVPPEDPKSLAGAIMRLASDAELRNRMGTAGRKHVMENLRWEENVRQMAKLYNRLIDGDFSR